VKDSAQPLTAIVRSLDTLDEEKFERITRRKGHSAVMKSLDTALSLLRPTPSATAWQPGLQAVKINNVLTRSTNLSEMTDFVRLTEHHPISVRFIEFMPFSGNKWDKDQMVPYDEALGIIRAEFGPENVIQLQNEDGDGTSKRWKIKGWKGEIGFISSMVRLLPSIVHCVARAYPCVSRATISAGPATA
jgi:molybdenum cofactor biosynthesis enzyme MoaA